MSLRVTTSVFAIIVLLSGCGKSTVELEGQHYVRAECKQDVDNLRDAIVYLKTRLQKLLQERATTNIATSQIAYEHAAPDSPLSVLKTISPCGQQALSAYLKFEATYVSAVTLPTDRAFQNAASAEQSEMMRSTMDEVNANTAALAAELKLLDDL